MILIGLGSSLSFAGRSPSEIVRLAAAAVGRLGTVHAMSRLYRSAAWPDPRDPSFVNACVALQTALAPAPLLVALQAIETGFGRRRTHRNGPRSLDLDLLDFGGLVMDCKGPPALALPHPSIADRRFVLAPLQEVAPEWRHPLTGESVEALLRRAPGHVEALD